MELPATCLPALPVHLYTSTSPLIKNYIVVKNPFSYIHKQIYLWEGNSAILPLEYCEKNLEQDINSLKVI